MRFLILMSQLRADFSCFNRVSEDCTKAQNSVAELVSDCFKCCTEDSDDATTKVS